MAGSINKVILVGNVGNEPEVKQMQDGRELVNLSIATSENWRDKNTGERREKTEWHRVTIFNEGLVKVVKNYVHKGSKLYIEGALQTRKWTGQDGQDRYTTEVVLQGFNGNLTMLDSKGSGGGNYANNNQNGGNNYNQQQQQSGAPAAFGQVPGGQQNQQQNAPAPELDDEIPF